MNPMRPRRLGIAIGAPPRDKFQRRRERRAGQRMIDLPLFAGRNRVPVQRFRCGDEQKFASSGGNVHNLLLRIVGALDVVDATRRISTCRETRRSPALAEMRQPEAQPAFQQARPTVRQQRKWTRVKEWNNEGRRTATIIFCIIPRPLLRLTVLAKVAELVDALDLGSSGATRGSSILPFRTNSRTRPPGPGCRLFLLKEDSTCRSR